MTDDRTLEERYAHEPGSFHACVDAYEIPGEPELSMVVRRICREKSVWPQLLSRSDLRKGYMVFARRLVWRAAYELTDLSVENIADIFGYSPHTIGPWATSWRRFEADDPEWWRFWGPANADLVGVPLEVAA